MLQKATLITYYSQNIYIKPAKHGSGAFLLENAKKNDLLGGMSFYYILYSKGLTDAALSEYVGEILKRERIGGIRG